MGSLSIWHWLVVLVIVVLIFGTANLRTWAKTSAAPLRASKKA